MKVFDNLEFGSASKLERFAKENILLTLCLLLQIHYVTYWCLPNCAPANKNKPNFSNLYEYIWYAKI